MEAVSYPAGTKNSPIRKRNNKTKRSSFKKGNSRMAKRDQGKLKRRQGSRNNTESPGEGKGNRMRGRCQAPVGILRAGPTPRRVPSQPQIGPGYLSSRSKGQQANRKRECKRKKKEKHEKETTRRRGTRKRTRKKVRRKQKINVYMLFHE